MIRVPYASTGFRLLRSAKPLLFAVVAGTLAACARPPSRESLGALVFSTPPPQLTDDLGFEGLAQAIENQERALRARPNHSLTFGDRTIRSFDYADALRALLSTIRTSPSPQAVADYIPQHFDFYRTAGDETTRTLLLTSYFEPIIEGSPVPTARFSQALFRAPPELVSIDLKQFSERFAGERPVSGRLDRTKVVPFWTRAEIDGAGVLRGRKLEICWVDPIDAFFLHIQGSGTVRFSDGRELTLAFADKNGRKYVAIGKFLKDKLAKVTLHTIERYLRSLSRDEQQQYMFLNESYVFFRQSTQRAVTSSGAPATAGRTIAADGRVFPKGALVFLEFQKPVFSTPEATEPSTFVPTSRFVLDQDSGGAIVGPGRMDLFWGRGAEAKQAAGVMQGNAIGYYLVPKSK
jgi:membrane-bound lytic murein transglycosylase A